MKNKGLFSTLFIEKVKGEVELDDLARGRMATLSQTWQGCDKQNGEALWNSFLKQAVSYLQLVPAAKPSAPGVYPLNEDFSSASVVTVLYLAEPGADLDDTSVGRFCPGKLVGELKRRSLNWGILTDGARWRLYSLKTAKPYEDFVELNLAEALGQCDEAEYALFERFFHRDSFIKETPAEEPEKSDGDESETKSQDEQAKNETYGVYKCRLDRDREASEKILEEQVKDPLLAQVDEILQYLCNGFIADTERKGAEYSEEERRDIFESAVKLLYRCLFLFYAEARSLLPSEPDKAEVYRKHSILNLCQEAHRFKWGQRKDTDGYDLWKHLKGLINAVNDGDPEYGIMGYNGGLFDDEQEKFLGKHKLRNDFLARALYQLAYVEPWDNDSDNEYPIPYEDLEVRHLGELYENILEFNVTLADADRIRRRTKKGIAILLASDVKFQSGDSRIKKGDVFFGETALERKQTGSYYTPETLVQFLNQKAVISPLRNRFEKDYRARFHAFCKDAASGRDLQTRRGAAQSAIALVERYVDEVVLRFRLCDPGMGSGHFLVNAANQITDLIVALLSEVPFVEGLKSKVLCAPNHWRRLVTRYCVYGVDLNPLAVHLAKLSLWLNCFARDHKLTFLDHHLKTGNSLIGIRVLDQLEKLPERAKAPRKTGAQGLLFPMDLKKACHRAVSEIEKIGKLDEDATDRMKELLDQARQESADIVGLADLFTSYLMDHSIKEEDYREMFSDLAQGKRPRSILGKEITDQIAVLKSRHHFFHWTIEFPEVFTGSDAGFDATAGNPPWDIVKPNSQEFFSSYDPAFRSYGKQQAERIAERLMQNNPVIRSKWTAYNAAFDEQSLYVRQPGAYLALGKGDINTFKLFLERFYGLLRGGGRMGIVTPSGLYNDQGCLPLRRLFFEHSRVECLYCFENRWPTVFAAVDGRFKFILFCSQTGGTTTAFKCAFMEHDPQRLAVIDSNALEMKIADVKKFSPDSWSVMEFRSQRDVDVTARIYGDLPLLGDELPDTWNVQFNAELHMTNDSGLFLSAEQAKDKDDCVRLWEGKQIWLLSDGFAEPTIWVQKSDVASMASVQQTRVAYRALAASTNERTLIATVIPAGSPCGHSINVAPLSIDRALLTAALFSSVVLDFVIRQKVTTNLTMFYLQQLPIPRNADERRDGILSAIKCRVTRLVCTSKDYAPLWEEAFEARWNIPAFWYPEAGSSQYGPADEQRLRERLAQEVGSLTPNWTRKCGVHDRTPAPRDIGDRAQLRAEIDAYVAHLYGLSRDDFEHILSTFPVLERKERQAFGEFVSKRKCLEEYDRLTPIIGEAK